MIQIRNLVFRYEGGDRPILSSLNLDIACAEYVALVGPNGCGKTTLIKHLNALLFPSEGEVRVDGLDTRDRHQQGEIRRRVGMVFQNPDNQIVGMSVEEDVAFGPGNLGLPPEEIRQRVDRALAATGITDLAQRTPHTLSGGEKRLVSIAGILAMKPAYIAFDEPTAYLDQRGRSRILDIMRQLPGQGIGVIHVTHDTNDITDADRVIVMEGGTVALDGRPREVFLHAEALRGMGLPVPQVTELMEKMAEAGWDVSPGVVTVDEACQEISASLNRWRGASRRRMGNVV